MQLGWTRLIVSSVSRLTERMAASLRSQRDDMSVKWTWWAVSLVPRLSPER